MQACINFATKYCKSDIKKGKIPDMFINVVSILLEDLLADWFSKKEAPPERLILDRLTFTNSRLMLNESLRPVTDDGSSSTLPITTRDNVCDFIELEKPKILCQFPQMYT